MKTPVQIEHQLKDDDILYFLHIPKTAGTSLISILDDNFDLDKICNKNYWSQWFDEIPKNFSKYELFRGHFGYGLYRYLNKKPLYITFLRDPLKRSLSHFENLKRTPGPSVMDFFSKSCDLSDFVNDPHYSLLLRNTQTRYIALDLDIFSIMETMEYGLKELIMDSLPQFISPNIPDDQLIKTAKQHLDDFIFVGLAERFEESLFLLYYTFGWKPRKIVPKLNESPPITNRNNLTKNTTSKILHDNKLDLELYEYAKQLFDQRYSLMLSTLKERYYESRFDNLSFNDIMYEYLEKHYQNRTYDKSISKINSDDLYFYKKISGNGWYPRENHNNTGVIFRWTGPENISTINLPLSTSNDLKIEFRVLMYLIPKILESLEVLVNNNPINLKVLFKNGEITTFTGIVPKTVLQDVKNFSQLSFQVANTISSHDINPDSPDHRKLGIAIDYIKIKPINN